MVASRDTRLASLVKGTMRLALLLAALAGAAALALASAGGTALAQGAVKRAASHIGARAIGAERCGVCHPRALSRWKESAHARAYDRLSPRQQTDRLCAQCHTLAASEGLRGVQCESCHGNGGDYAPALVMRDPMLAAALGLVARPASRSCKTCHDRSTPSLHAFEYAEGIKIIEHADVAPSETKPTDEAQKSN